MNINAKNTIKILIKAQNLIKILSKGISKCVLKQKQAT